MATAGGCSPFARATIPWGSSPAGRSRRARRRVYRLKAALSDVPVIINGGIGSIEETKGHLRHVDGVMLGRAAYQEPWRLLAVDAELFGATAPHATMKEVFAAMLPYIERE